MLLQIDLPTFLTLTDRDLRELGISTFGARKKMLLAIAGRFYCPTVHRLNLHSFLILNFFMSISFKLYSVRNNLKDCQLLSQVTSFNRKHCNNEMSTNPVGALVCLSLQPKNLYPKPTHTGFYCLSFICRFEQEKNVNANQFGTLWSISRQITPKFTPWPWHTYTMVTHVARRPP